MIIGYNHIIVVSLRFVVQGQTHVSEYSCDSYADVLYEERPSYYCKCGRGGGGLKLEYRH